MGLNYVQKTAADRPAAGAARGDPAADQHLHRLLQGHLAGADHRHLRLPQHRQRGARRPQLGRASRPRSTCSPPSSTSSSATRCRDTASTSRSISTRGRAARRREENTTMAATAAARDLSNAPSVITLTGVNKWFGQFHVLSDINLDVKEGEKIVDLRPVGLGQVDADPLHQPPRGAPGRRHRRRRRDAQQRRQEHRGDPPRSRHGVPVVQPLPAPHHPRQPDLGADLGEEDAQEGRRGDRHEPARSACASPSRR